MSAPIDDLLYGGDDSGDEDDLNAGGPLSSYSAPLPSTGGIPLAPPMAAPLGAPAGVISASQPSSATPSAAMGMPLSASAAALGMPAARPTAPATQAAAAPVKTAGSGHHMFQQMFALLKQMLPPEQYAALHSEMRNGNGNDIKSIVDIIKRIAGDAIFAKVIQKMDLTRNNSAAAGSFGIIKSEQTPAMPVPNGVSGSNVPAASRPVVAAPAATPTPVPMPTAPIPQPLAPPPSLTATTAIQRPTLPSTISTPAPGLPGVKAEPIAPAVQSQQQSTAPGAAATGSSAATGAAAGTKNEAMEKIQFAKKLLFHASTCQLPPSICQVKKCDDVRRVFKHSASCNGAKGCSHCKQLRALVEYHAKECLVPVGDHCNIPFCDPIRRSHAASRARTVSAGGSGGSTPTSSATSTPPTMLGTVMSDDDEDNTPLATTVLKKKNLTKAKSPKASPSTSSTPTAVAKKKPTVPVTKTPTPVATTTTPGLPNNAAATAAATAAANAAKPKTEVQKQAMEYGRLLQMILHVEKCKTAACPVGEECAEAKSLLRQVNQPDAPVRAQTYKKVYAHYKMCVSKNNTQNCPMCRIGLMPLSTTPATTTPSAPTSSLPSTNTATAASTENKSHPATSPTIPTMKRSNSIASPRSPSKKPRVNPKGGKAETSSLPLNVSTDHVSSDLSQVTVNDMHKEADVLTHTSIELSGERRMMLDGSRRKYTQERLPCKKEQWASQDLFNNDMLRSQMQAIAARQGVTLGGRTTDIMAYALQEYLKQAIEEMVETAKQRGDGYGQSLDQLVKKDASITAGGAAAARELTSTDILRVSCESSFSQLRTDDLALRTRLLEEAKKEEQAEKERAKKRKKVDRVKLQAQEEKDEAEMDLEELAVKDLKERLLQEDKDGIVRVDGRVNDSIASKFLRRVDNQVTMEDATFWLQNQKPYIQPKLFVRAEAARIVTKALL